MGVKVIHFVKVPDRGKEEELNYILCFGIGPWYFGGRDAWDVTFQWIL